MGWTHIVRSRRRVYAAEDNCQIISQRMNSSAAHWSFPAFNSGVHYRITESAASQRLQRRLPDTTWISSLRHSGLFVSHRFDAAPYTPFFFFSFPVRPCCPFSFFFFF